MRSSQKAFTLIELMVTLVVLGVVAAIAVPNFNSAILSNKSVGLAEDFITEANVARSEAIKRATRITMCASNTGTTCAGTWSDGFITFIDGVATDQTSPPVVGTILHKWSPSDSRAIVSVKRGTTDAAFIRYTPLGTLARINDETIVILSKMQGCKDDSARQITIGHSGILSTKKWDCKLF